MTPAPTRGSSMRRVAQICRKHDVPKVDAEFERLNIAAWFDACARDGEPLLSAYVKRMQDLLDSAKGKGSAPRHYIELRQVFLDVALHFQQLKAAPAESAS